MILNTDLEYKKMGFLRPTYLVDGDITTVDLNKLRLDGIKGIILDLDSTLVAPRSGQLTGQAAQWLTAAKENFKLAVVSNNNRQDYVDQVAQHIGIPVIGKAAKPRRGMLRKTLEMLSLDPAESVLIGDRPLTDIWAGQRLGMKTILVYPLGTMNEAGWIKFCRKLERLFIRQ